MLAPPLEDGTCQDKVKLFEAMLPTVRDLGAVGTVARVVNSTWVVSLKPCVFRAETLARYLVAGDRPVRLMLVFVEADLVMVDQVVPSRDVSTL